MKLAANIVGGLLGIAFVFFAMLFFLKVDMKVPPPPPGSAEAMFMGSFGPSGWMVLVKACELLGGILVAVPKTRNLGLLVLGPVLINILACNVFIQDPAKSLNPPIAPILCLMALFLLWVERKAFCGLVNR